MVSVACELAFTMFWVCDVEVKKISFILLKLTPNKDLRRVALLPCPYPGYLCET